MNKIAMGWSVGLLVLSVLAVVFPAPVAWLSPLAGAAAWFVTWRSRRVPVLPESQTIQSQPPTLPPPVVEIREIVPPALEDDVQRLKAAVEVVFGFKELVATDTEASVMRVTQALFVLVETSKKLSQQIEKSLSFLTDGDSGLRKTLINLEQQVRVFQTLASHFSQVKEDLTQDIGALTKTVGSINQFSETLSDLADQTNVLAINASIEAARVGQHGRGFAVIATQIQNLAKDSKSIAETMAKTVREVVGNVEASFHRQAQRIGDAEGLIVQSDRELRRWAEHIAPQLAEAGVMVTESRAMATSVTHELEDVTVSLQFQDRTKQILGHLAQTLAESSNQVFRSAGVEAKPISELLRREVHESASRHFTVKEEWALVSTVNPAGPLDQARKSVELF